MQSFERYIYFTDQEVRDECERVEIDPSRTLRQKERQLEFLGISRTLGVKHLHCKLMRQNVEDVCVGSKHGTHPLITEFYVPRCKKLPRILLVHYPITQVLHS
jgi:hypothetical protein